MALANSELVSVTLPSWGTAISTILLAIGTSYLALRAYQERRQSERERGDREKAATLAQARLVSAWLTGTTLSEPAQKRRASEILTRPESSDVAVAELNNGADEPVYDAVVTTVYVAGDGPRTGEDWTEWQGPGPGRATVQIVAPGRWQVRLRDTPPLYGSQQFGVEIAFTDRAGQHWVRRSNGSLEPLARDAITNYGMRGPVLYDQPEPVA